MCRLSVLFSFALLLFSEAKLRECVDSLAISTVITREGRAQFRESPRPRSSGEGGMGIVSIETPPGYSHAVAVKRNKGFKTLEAIRNEAHILFLLAKKGLMGGFLEAAGIKKKKKFIPDIYAYSEHGLDAGELHMEVIPGKTFDDSHQKVMTANEFKTQARVYLNQIKDILEGLEWMHSRGVLHLDVKGPNVMVKDNNEIRLIDFGTALEYKKKDAKYFLLGATPEFASPEVRGLIPEYRANNPSTMYSDEALSPLSDSYSVGVMLQNWLDDQLNNTIPGGLTREMRGLLLVLRSNVANPMLAHSSSNRMGAAAARKEIDRILLDPQLSN